VGGNAFCAALVATQAPLPRRPRHRLALENAQRDADANAVRHVDALSDAHADAVADYDAVKHGVQFGDHVEFKHAVPNAKRVTDADKDAHRDAHV
jgi:hypothetical protein